MNAAAMHTGTLYRTDEYLKPQAALNKLGRKHAVAPPLNRRCSGSSRPGLFGLLRSMSMGECRRRSDDHKKAVPGENWNRSVLLRCLKHRQRKYAERVIRGHAKVAAALAAGYSRSTARNAAAVIERPVVRFVLQQIIRNRKTLMRVPREGILHSRKR